MFGGLVWILLASTNVSNPNPLGWVMFVSVFCFVMTFAWMIIFAAGGHKGSSSWAAAVRPEKRSLEWNNECHKRMKQETGFMWKRVDVCVQDFAYHGLAAFFYLSAAVLLAYFTYLSIIFPPKIYKINIAAVVSTQCIKCNSIQNGFRTFIWMFCFTLLAFILLKYCCDKDEQSFPSSFFFIVTWNPGVFR